MFCSNCTQTHKMSTNFYRYICKTKGYSFNLINNYKTLVQNLGHSISIRIERAETPKNKKNRKKKKVIDNLCVKKLFIIYFYFDQKMSVMRGD